MNGGLLYFFLVIDLVHVFLTNVAYGQTTENPMCSETAFNDCSGHIPEPEFSEAMNASGPSPEVMDRYCAPLIKFSKCLKDFADICVEEREAFVQTEAMFNYINELCDRRSVLHDNIDGRDPLCTQEGHGCQNFTLGDDFWAMMATSGPNAANLERFCPRTKNFLNCSKTIAEVCLSDEVANQLSNVYSIVLKLCDVHSRLHQAFVADIDCVYALRDQYPSCMEPSRNQQLLYQDHVEQEENSYVVDKESKCLYDYLMLNCMAARIAGSCGDAATETFWEIAIQAKQPCFRLDIDGVEAKYLAVLRGLDPPADIDPPNLFHHRPVRH